MEREVLKLIALAQMMLETIDELKGTPLYKFQVKQQLNRTEAILLSSFGQSVNHMYKSEPKFANELMENIEHTVDMLSSLNIDEISILGHAINELKKNKEDDTRD